MDRGRFTSTPGLTLKTKLTDIVLLGNMLAECWEVKHADQKTRGY